MYKAIVLDTSAIMPDFYFQNPRLRAVIDSARHIGMNIALPYVVIEELKANYRKRCQELKAQADKHRGLFLEPILTDDQVTTTCQNYDGWLDNLVAQELNLLPLAKVASNQLLVRALANRKPFDSNGRGIKDVLIWESILDLLRSEKDICIAFVSGNTTDFSDGSELHPDLLADLEANEVSRDRLKFYPSLKECLNIEFDPYLDKLEEVRQQLQDGTFKGFNIEAWLLGDGEDLFSGAWSDKSAVDTDPNVIEITLKRFKRPIEIVVENAYQLSSNEISFSFKANASCEINKERTVDTIKDRSIRFSQLDEFAAWLMGTVTLNQETKEVSSFELDIMKMEESHLFDSEGTPIIFTAARSSV